MTDFLDALIELAQQTPLFSPILRGPLTAAPSITMEIEGSVPTAHMDRREAIRSSVVIRGKHADMATAFGAVLAIAQLLSRRKEYPSGENWQIVSVYMENAPRLIGREKDNTWLIEAKVGVWVYE